MTELEWIQVKTLARRGDLNFLCCLTSTEQAQAIADLLGKMSPGEFGALLRYICKCNQVCTITPFSGSGGGGGGNGQAGGGGGTGGPSTADCLADLEAVLCSPVGQSVMSAALSVLKAAISFLPDAALQTLGHAILGVFQTVADDCRNDGKLDDATLVSFCVIIKFFNQVNNTNPLAYLISPVLTLILSSSKFTEMAKCCASVDTGSDPVEQAVQAVLQSGGV